MSTGRLLSGGIRRCQGFEPGRRAGRVVRSGRPQRTAGCWTSPHLARAHRIGWGSAPTPCRLCPVAEIEKAWKMVDHSHEKESRAKEIINSLKGEITNLSKLVEQGAGMSVGQEQQLNDLLAEKNQLAAERDAQVTRRKTPHRPPAASSDRAFIGLHPQRQACKPRMAPSLDAAEPASPHLTHPPTLCSSFPIPLPASSLPTPSGGAHLRATGANLGASRRNQRARIRARAHLEENFRDQNSARQRRR
eukprot:scaffold21750_cov128-Isochrysis_galbana.AAC.13